MTKDFKNLKNRLLATRVKVRLKCKRAASLLNNTPDLLNSGDPHYSAWELPCGPRKVPRCRIVVTTWLLELLNDHEPINEAWAPYI